MPITLNGDTGVTYPVTAGGTSAVQASSSKVLQVVSTTSTTLFTSTSTSPVDVTGISVTITPSNSSSKVMVVFNCAASATNSLNFYLNRNGINIALGSGGSSKNATICSVPTGNNAYLFSYALNFLDSPATTSAVTYKIQADTDGGTFYVNRRGSDALFASPATITVMEIAA